MEIPQKSTKFHISNKFFNTNESLIHRRYIMHSKENPGYYL